MKIAYLTQEFDVKPSRTVRVRVDTASSPPRYPIPLGGRVCSGFALLDVWRPTISLFHF